MFSGIWCFGGMFSLQVKLESEPYQVSLWYIAYAPQTPFKEELERLQQLDIITPLGIDEMADRCNSFILVPNPNGKVRLCLESARCNQAHVRLVHREPTLSFQIKKM